jgi:hypothetical protein
MQYCEDHDLGVWGQTTTGQAFNAYRHRFMPAVPYIHTNQPVIELEREAYHGGRSECFKIGHFDKGPYYMVDVNSMYPASMYKEQFPVMLKSFITRAKMSILKKVVKKYGAIARCRIDTKDPIYPTWHNKRLVFPTGQFDATLSTPEIIHGLKHHNITDVSMIAIYELDNIFSNYVSFFYGQRLKFKEDNNVMYGMLAKLMLNSLYGKFGQKIDVWETVNESVKHPDQAWKEWDMDKQKMRSFRCICGKLEEVTGFDEGFNSFPAVAAHVTAYARMDLWKLIVQAGLKNCFYCDTDSLIVNQKGFDKLGNQMHDSDLGMLKLEETADSMDIFNVKQYEFGKKSRLKGVRKNAELIAPNTYSQWHQIHIAGALRSKTSDVCTWKQITKHISTTYKKGYVDEKGNVTPFHLSENVNI